MKLLFLFSLLLLLPSTGIKGQDIQLNLNRVDFGILAPGANTPKSVSFTNNSKQRLAILLVEKGENVKVNYQRKFYAPGETGLLYLYYEPRNTGKFEESIHIYTNLSDQAVDMSIKGEVVSILECFPDPKNLLKRHIEVLNEITKEPIPGAELAFIHNFKNTKPIEVTTDKEGKAVKELAIGQYSLEVKANKFETLNTEFFLPKSKPKLIFELTPLIAPIVPNPLLPEPVPTATIITEPTSPISNLSPDLPEDRYHANNITLLLDVSTSMKSGKKFMLLQQAINNLVMILRPIDNVSVISYSSKANIILTGVNGADKDKLISAIEELKPYGITRGVKGLQTAYELAGKNFIQGGNNQIILATDGEFSEQSVPDSYYTNLIGGKSQAGVNLSILGFGVNKDAIKRMEAMANTGKGSFVLIGADSDTKNILIEEVKDMSLMGQR